MTIHEDDTLWVTDPDAPKPPKRPDPMTATADPLPGTIIDDRYLLIERLGEGGMGHVYRANHVHMDKQVAIKLIHAELSHMEEIARRFEREARSSSRLNSPHCITVTDFGRTDNQQMYLAMELLEGEDLHARLEREGRIPVSEALPLFSQILKGLHHAHEQGVIHRDLKPENIFLTQSDGSEITVKILDFGIAKITSDTTAENLTKTGVVFGTPKYLSPEQALGDQVDHRADIYAAGVLLFEILAGTPPFKAATAMETLSLHLTAQVPRLSGHGSFPAGLQRVINLAMAKKASERYSDAMAFLRDIEAISLTPSAGLTRLRKLYSPLCKRVDPLKQRGATLLWASSKRKGISVAGVTLLFLLSFLFLETRSGRLLDRLDEEHPSANPSNPVSGSQTPEEPSGEELFLDIHSLLEERNYADAIRRIRPATQRKPDSAPLRTLYGIALYASGKHAAGLYQYRLALQRDAQQIQNDPLRTHLMESLRFSEFRDRAAQLLIEYGTTADLERLGDICNSAFSDGELRRAIRNSLKKGGKEDVIDWYETLTADFHEMNNCKDRNRLIMEMARTEDLRFVPFLETYRPETITREDGSVVTRNACLRASVEAAILQLNPEPPETTEVP